MTFFAQRHVFTDDGARVNARSRADDGRFRDTRARMNDGFPDLFGGIESRRDQTIGLVRFFGQQNRRPRRRGTREIGMHDAGGRVRFFQIADVFFA